MGIFINDDINLYLLFCEDITVVERFWRHFY